MKLGALEKVAADTEAATRMIVVDPDSRQVLKCADGKECYIDFLSVDSETGRRLERQRTTAQLAKLRSGRNRRAEEEDADMIKLQAETCAALATGWYFGDDADPFSKDAALDLFSNPKYAWLRRDSFVYVNETANFIKSSSKT